MSKKIRPGITCYVKHVGDMSTPELGGRFVTVLERPGDHEIFRSTDGRNVASLEPSSKNSWTCKSSSPLPWSMLLPKTRGREVLWFDKRPIPEHHLVPLHDPDMAVEIIESNEFVAVSDDLTPDKVR